MRELRYFFKNFLLGFGLSVLLSLTCVLTLLVVLRFKDPLLSKLHVKMAHVAMMSDVKIVHFKTVRFAYGARSSSEQDIMLKDVSIGLNRNFWPLSKKGLLTLDIGEVVFVADNNISLAAQLRDIFAALNLSGESVFGNVRIRRLLIKFGFAGKSISLEGDFFCSSQSGDMQSIVIGCNYKRIRLDKMCLEGGGKIVFSCGNMSDFLHSSKLSWHHVLNSNLKMTAVVQSNLQRLSAIFLKNETQPVVAIDLPWGRADSVCVYDKDFFANFGKSSTCKSAEMVLKNFVRIQNPDAVGLCAKEGFFVFRPKFGDVVASWRVPLGRGALRFDMRKLCLDAVCNYLCDSYWLGCQPKVLRSYCHLSSSDGFAMELDAPGKYFGQPDVLRLRSSVSLDGSVLQNYFSVHDIKAAASLKNFKLADVALLVGGESLVQTVKSENGLVSGIVKGVALNTCLVRLVPQLLAQDLQGDLHFVFNQADALCRLFWKGEPIYLLANDNKLLNFSAAAQLDYERQELVLQQANAHFELGSAIGCGALSSQGFWFDWGVKNFLLSNDKLFSCLDALVSVIKLRGSPCLAKINCQARNTLFKIESLHKDTSVLPVEFSKYLSSHRQDMKILCSLTTPGGGFVIGKGLQLAFSADLLLSAILDLNRLDVAESRCLGNVDFRAGRLKVFDTNLQLVSGQMRFDGGPLNEPLMQAALDGRVKNYHVNLHAFGRPSNLSIDVSSDPFLGEEKLISLILAGVESESLATALPGIIMKSINFLTERSDSFTFLGSALQKITHPMKAISLLPSFNESSNQLGAVLDLDVGPNFSASLNKGLHSQDDLALRLEYLMNENLSVKFSRDFRGLLQGGLEVKFAF